MSGREHRVGCGWVINLLGGLATFVFCIYFGGWVIMELGASSLPLLIVKLILIVGPIAAVGLVVTVLLANLAGG